MQYSSSIWRDIFFAYGMSKAESRGRSLSQKLSEVESTGAEILGFHLEGPFLCVTGALPREALGNADDQRIESLIAAAKPYPAIFSISPEFERITELIPVMAENNTPVFITHTRAGAKETQAAIEAGARHATHFYNVFYSPAEAEAGVRPCGAVEAILADDRVSVDFILDGEHVDPVAVKMALACKGPDGVSLITDASVGAGLPPGQYRGINNAEIEFAYPGGPARMVGNGGLAGSGLTMDRVVRNAKQMLQVDLPQAIRMVSANPADVLGLQDRKGVIVEGYDADMVLLDDELQVIKTWVAGKCVFEKNGEVA